MSKLLLSTDDYKKYTGISFEEAFVIPYEKHRKSKRCAYCGAYGPTHKDHVIPKSRGGSNDNSNLVWACGECNVKKGRKTPEEAGLSILYPEESKIK